MFNIGASDTRFKTLYKALLIIGHAISSDATLDREVSVQHNRLYSKISANFSTQNCTGLPI